GAWLLDARSRRIQILGQSSFVLSSKPLPDRGFAENRDGKWGRQGGTGFVFGSWIFHIAAGKDVRESGECGRQSCRHARSLCQRRDRRRQNRIVQRTRRRVFEKNGRETRHCDP